MTRRPVPWVGLLALALAGAAVNTGNNLLYLCLSLLVALRVVHAVASRRALRTLVIETVLPEEAVRGEPFLAGVCVAGRFPLAARSWLAVRLEGLPQPVAWSVCLPSERGRAVASSLAVVDRRGVYETLALVGATAYPLGLSERRVGRPHRGRLVVLPAFRRLTRVRVGLASGGAAEARPSPAGRAGGAGGDLHGLREYVPSDDARRIEWRSSARSGRLMVREFEREQEPWIDLVLDPEAPGDDAFEEAVERCAALLDFARRGRLDVRLLAEGEEGHLEGRAAMHRLAEVRPAAPGSSPGWLAGAVRRARPGARVVVVSAYRERATPLELA